MSSPLSMTVPPRTVTSPNIALSSVDLPAPLGPMMPTSSPLRRCKLQPLQDVDPGQVAGHQVVGPQQRVSGQFAVPLWGRGQLRVGQPDRWSSHRSRRSRRQVLTALDGRLELAFDLGDEHRRLAHRVALGVELQCLVVVGAEVGVDDRLVGR